MASTQFPELQILIAKFSLCSGCSNTASNLAESHQLLQYVFKSKFWVVERIEVVARGCGWRKLGVEPDKYEHKRQRTGPSKASIPGTSEAVEQESRAEA